MTRLTALTDKVDGVDGVDINKTDESRMSNEIPRVSALSIDKISISCPRLQRVKVVGYGKSIL
jgi:hypothetical protein